jgi:serine/threonine protein kinase
MGVVVAGRHVRLGNRVAIKFLLPEAAHHAEATARFLREARAAVQIQSEHVARVSDVGTLENGAPYMVMEFLSGSDLGKLLSARGAPFAIEEAVDYLLQACEAIAEAHALGIIHRDLKPANLFLTHRADGSALVKVLDFGISKMMAGPSAQVSLTGTASVMGSPAYMSPEQVRSAKNVDARTDVWSLGMILYEFLTARPAFVAETVSGLLAQIVADPPTPLRARRPDIPARLETVVMRCLEKDPGRRIGNVAEFAQALLPFSPSSQISVERIRRVLQSGAALGASPETSAKAGSRGDLPHAVTVGSWGSTGSRSIGGRRKWLLLALSVGALGGIGSAYYASRTPAGAPPSAALPLDPRAGASAPTTAEPAPDKASPLFDPAPSVVPVPDVETSQRGGTIPVQPALDRGRAGTPRTTGPKPVRAPGAGGTPAASAQPKRDLFDDIH